MSTPVFFISTKTLEDWDWRTPWERGIGGSEQSHIEMAQRLKEHGYDVFSYTPCVNDNLVYTWGGGEQTRSLKWYKDTTWPEHNDCKGIVINYRNPDLFKRAKPSYQKWWFIAQDVDYPWDPEALSKVDRYVCLCDEHVKFTARKYPELKGKLYKSSNGVRTSYLNIRDSVPIERVPYRMFYASSPDRGLKILLERWNRITERFPNATLHVAYGFENMDILAKAFNDWHGSFKTEVEELCKQDGVSFLGRLPLPKLYEEWYSASVWPYPSSWPETSCITCMDAQACGAIPVTTNYWGQGENTLFGYKQDGLPDKSDLANMLWLNNLYKALDDPFPERVSMIRKARHVFDWERMVYQWGTWIEEDSWAL